MVCAHVPAMVSRVYAKNMKIPCTVEVLTYNSGKTLGRCLESLVEFDDILVLDGNSTDDTLEIATRFGARILPQSDSTEKNVPITDFSAVRNVGIKAAKHQWFLFVDSDEYLSPEAVVEIRSIVTGGSGTQPLVYRMPRKYVVDGVVIERSAMYPNYQTRFFYIPAVYGFVKPVHEKLRIREGEALGTLTYPTYVPFESPDAIILKWKRYAEQQIANHHVTVSTILPYSMHNIVQSAKYVVKILWTRFGSGPALPLRYEWHNVLYHLRLISLSWGKLFRS